METSLIPTCLYKNINSHQTKSWLKLNVTPSILAVHSETTHGLESSEASKLRDVVKFTNALLKNASSNIACTSTGIEASTQRYQRQVSYTTNELTQASLQPLRKISQKSLTHTQGGLLCNYRKKSRTHSAGLGRDASEQHCYNANAKDLQSFLNR